MEDLKAKGNSYYFVELQCCHLKILQITLHGAVF